jgi:hypothetical protein
MGGSLSHPQLEYVNVRGLRVVYVEVKKCGLAHRAMLRLVQRAKRVLPA